MANSSVESIIIIIIIIIIIEYVTLNCNVHKESIPPHIRDIESGQNKAK
jgi:hypothetical protein